VLGFDQAADGDEVFRGVVLARIIDLQGLTLPEFAR
jgi:hypothetical protein